MKKVERIDDSPPNAVASEATSTGDYKRRLKDQLMRDLLADRSDESGAASSLGLTAMLKK